MDSVLLADVWNARWKCIIETIFRKKHKKLLRRLSSHFFPPFRSVFTMQASFVRRGTKYRRQKIPYTYFVRYAFLSPDYLSNKRYKPITYLQSD
jgi:hypothetical protein